MPVILPGGRNVVAGRTLYMLPFDRRGVPLGTVTTEEAIVEAASVDVTDVVVLCHGWNNSFGDAFDWYSKFIEQVEDVRGRFSPPSARPMYVGVSWPSISLLASWEQPPDIAAAGVGTTQDDPLAALGEPWSSDSELVALLSHDAITEAQADELETRLALLSDVDADIDEPEPLTTAPAAAAPVSAGIAAPEIAGVLSNLDPRWLMRGFTVYQMKDRAAAVGRLGVRALLERLAQARPGHVHVVGHSYGCKVLLAALSGGVADVRSALLLQPAVSRWCMADVMDTGAPGGYRSALDHVTQPILATYSARDIPLRRFFHLALRRRSDLGDTEAPELAGTPRFGALGGWGAAGVPSGVAMTPLAPPATYRVDAGTELVSLDCSNEIRGHGDIVNDTTAWALVSLMSDAIAAAPSLATATPEIATATPASPPVLRGDGHIHLVLTETLLGARLAATLPDGTSGFVDDLRREELGLDGGITKSRDGTPRRTQPPTAVDLPPTFVDRLTRTLVGADGVVWLQVPPDSELALLQWEQWLRPLVKGPVVRKILQPPTLSPEDELVIALVSSVPAAKSSFQAPHVVSELAEALATRMNGRVEIHIFTDRDCIADVTNRVGTIATVHPAPTNELLGGSRTEDSEQVRSPWLKWIATVLDEVSAVHFVCHGYCAQERGFLALARSPVVNIDPEWSHFVGARELSTFADSLRVRAVGFTVPDHEPPGGHLALLRLPGTLATLRPGGALVVDRMPQSSGADVADAYAAILRGVPPTSLHPALRLYSSPSALAIGTPGHAEAIAEKLRRLPKVQPKWQRVLEQRTLGIASAVPDDEMSAEAQRALDLASELARHTGSTEEITQWLRERAAKEAKR